jgi:hypothetical protein
MRVPTRRRSVHNSRRAALAVRVTVWLTGCGVLAAAGIGGLDVASGACAAAALVVLAISTMFLSHWPNGPTGFLIIAIAQCATAPRPSTLQAAAMVIMVAAYLFVVDAAQSGMGSSYRGFRLPQLGPFAIGAVVGLAIVGLIVLRFAGDTLLVVAASALAGGAAVGAIMLAGTSTNRGG